MLIEAGGWRLPTDPTFDPAGGRYSFGWGTGSRKLADPAEAAADLGPIDAVLLSHDQHEDNLDRAGRALLPAVWDGQQHGVLWISGDTVPYDGLLEVARRLEVDTALIRSAASASRSPAPSTTP